MTSNELFPRCALPGCANPTDTQGHPCGTCRRDFNTLLRHNPAGTPMSATAQADRDQAVHHAYTLQAELAAAGDRALAIETGHRDKPGQVCWLCEERRSCIRVHGRWECRTCRHIDR